MTAIINTGAESIRVSRDYLPLLLALQTSGAVGVDAATTAALDILEEEGLLRDGDLHPMAGAMLEIIADPGLVVSVERMRLGAVAATTLWVTPRGMVVGSRVEPAVFELKLGAAELVPFHLMQLIHLRPLPQTARFEHVIGVEAMLSAEDSLYQGDSATAVKCLHEAGVADAAGAVELLAARIASWRIHSIWSTSDGSSMAEASGMDCGWLGHVLVRTSERAPSMTLQSATFEEVLAAVRAALPAARRLNRLGRSDQTQLAQPRPQRQQASGDRIR